MPFSSKYKIIKGIPFSNEKHLKEVGFENALKKLEESNLCFFSNNVWYCSVCNQQLFAYWEDWGWKIVINPDLHKKHCSQLQSDIIPLNSKIDLNALSQIKTSELTVQEHNNLIAVAVRYLYLEGLEKGKIIKRKGNPNDDYIWHV